MANRRDRDLTERESALLHMLAIAITLVTNCLVAREAVVAAHSAIVRGQIGIGAGILRAAAGQLTRYVRVYEAHGRTEYVYWMRALALALWHLSSEARRTALEVGIPIVPMVPLHEPGPVARPPDNGWYVYALGRSPWWPGLDSGIVVKIDRMQGAHKRPWRLDCVCNPPDHWRSQHNMTGLFATEDEARAAADRWLPFARAIIAAAVEANGRGPVAVAA